MQSVIKSVITSLNAHRDFYLQEKEKFFWKQVIMLLPESYNQKSTVQMHYAVLRNMYHARKNHKLHEWRELCEWCETLPQAWLITMD